LRIFTNEEESALAEFIRSEVLSTGCIFQDVDFRSYALSAWNEKDGLREQIKHFNCSNGFIYDFKRRHGFSSRMFHYKRRPSVTGVQRSRWLADIQALLREVDHDCVLNTDETSWCLWPHGILTWCQRNTDHVQALIDGSEKDNFTALATITASGKRLPLFILAHGKTERAERSQIGDVGTHWVSHSLTGWMTEVTFEEYLDHLRGLYHDGEELHLLLDSYSAHRTPGVRSKAEALNIRLHFIPPGMTDEFQPLDRKVFGILNAYGKMLFLRRLTEFASRRTKRHAVQDLIAAWEHLSPTPIEAAWEIYQQE
jgi:hypothetical protein